MSTHRWIDKICVAAVLLALILTAVFVNGDALGIRRAEQTMGYEARLFDTDRVHTIDIVMDDWDSFIETCENEEYQACSVVIDGEAFGNVGIRAKGNTSLSSVSRMDSDRYSFKVEFDQYESGKSYYGLDKLCLNNLIQDNTMMKDYLVYQLMARMGAAAPLCSFVYITVNGRDWGLYLAVEAVEDGFLQRNYGSDHGELYKPDAMNMGGGRGNGKDFRMEDFDPEELADRADRGEAPRTQDGGRPDGAQRGEEHDPMGGGMGTADVKLQYIDDDPDSYTNIFDSAKTDLTDADRTRLIAALKKLSAGEDLEQAVDVEAVIRYFVVHNFVVNGDSYTGSMIHNYYLYEENGRLSMLPWDYNLAFGGFQTNDASGAVNEDIDRGAELTDRPMVAWIFSSEAYTRRYHQLMEEFVSTVDIGALIDETAALIAPYVERDPGKFCTYEEFETGVAALKQFVALRSEAVSQQLAGDETPVDATSLQLSDMGSMDLGGGMGGPGNMADMGNRGDRNGWSEPGQENGRGTAPPDEGDLRQQAWGPDQRSEGAPENMGFPGDGSAMGAGDGASWSAEQRLALAASALVLAAGLLAAAVYKRK